MGRPAKTKNRPPREFHKLSIRSRRAVKHGGSKGLYARAVGRGARPAHYTSNRADHDCPRAHGRKFQKPEPGVGADFTATLFTLDAHRKGAA
jgi:hypothetical protein